MTDDNQEKAAVIGTAICVMVVGHLILDDIRCKLFDYLMANQTFVRAFVKKSVNLRRHWLENFFQPGFRALKCLGVNYRFLQYLCNLFYL